MVRFILIIAVLSLTPAYALIELASNFSYDKQVYGSQRQNSIVDREYSGSIALYIFRSTALQLSVSKGIQTITENRDPDGVNIVVVSDQTRIKTDTYSVGFRQAFANPKGRFVPMLSLGYAKQFVSTSETFTIDDAGTRIVISTDNFKQRTDNAFGTFTLKMKLTRRFFITGSVNTVFKAFEFSQAKDFLRYRVGFSWYL